MSKNSQTTTTLDDIDEIAESMTGRSGRTLPADTKVITINPSVKELGLSGERALIKIFETKEESEKGPVFVGLNGCGFQIPRGVFCDVPVEVLEVLENAVVKSYETRDGIIIGEIDTPRHAYQQKLVRREQVAEAA